MLNILLVIFINYSQIISIEKILKENYCLLLYTNKYLWEYGYPTISFAFLQQKLCVYKRLYLFDKKFHIFQGI